MVRNVKLLVAAALFYSGAVSSGLTATLFSQVPATIENAHYSDFDTPQITYTQLSIATASTIHNVTWRGIYLLGDEQPAAVDNFRIALFPDTAGGLGSPHIADISAFNSVNRTDTGTDFNSRSVFQYNFDLNLSVDAGTYWLAIINNTGVASSSWAWIGGPGAGGSDLIGFVFGPPAGPSAFPSTSRYVIVEGDVNATPAVPLPPAVALFATGLAALGLITRRRKKVRVTHT